MFLQKQIFMVSDECTLLKQFKSGEREAFDRLFKMYAPQLGYFCLRLVRQEDAEEIAAEFEKAYPNNRLVDVRSLD